MDKTWFLVGAGALVLLYAFKKGQSGNSVLALGNLAQTYDPDNVNRLINLETALTGAVDPNTGNPLTRTQILLLLSQALQETGLFGSNPNFKNMDQDNNYAGINAHGSFPADSYGTYAVYPDLPTFVDDWLNILNRGAQPIEADNVSDFVTRLKANNYFTDNINTYMQNVNAYYNLLNQL